MCSCSGSCNCNSTTIPRGPQGPAGPQGLNGTIWLNGPGDPSPSEGLNNDYWLDTDTGNLWIKAYQGLDLLWFYVTNIYGTPGIDGVALQLIPFAGGFFKSLGISNWITPISTGLNVNYYSTLFYLLGNDLCPVDNSVARITIFYETTGQENGVVGPAAYVTHNLLITTGGNSTPVIGPGSSLIPKTTISTTGNTYAFTKVCYTIRRKTINTAEIITEWFANTDVDNFLGNTAGSYYSSDFLITGSIDFTPTVYNEFKFYPTIVNSTPSSSPQTKAISLYIEKLR
jgi:hypothetical protein